MRIKDISLENQPVERLLRNGASALSNAELLAVILKTGVKGENVVDVCNALISKYSVSGLSSCSLDELISVKGIGVSKASQIIALFEFSKRCSFFRENDKPIESPKDVFDFCFSKIGFADKEHFMVLLLDTKNRVIKDVVVSVGTLNCSLVHPREIFKPAIKESANSIILVHNHPSGDFEPSSEDIKITELLVKSGDLLSIKVLDHVILGDGSFCSLNERGLL